MLGPNISIPVSYACKDGYVQAIPALNWSTFVPWMEEHGLAGELTTLEWQERLATLATDWPPEQIAYAHRLVAAFLGHFTKQELYDSAMQRRQLLYPVQTVHDAFNDPQLQARQYFVSMESPALGMTLTYPGEPFRMSATPWRLQGPAPRLGEHNALIYGQELGLAVAEREALQREGVI